MDVNCVPKRTAEDSPELSKCSLRAVIPLCVCHKEILEEAGIPLPNPAAARGSLRQREDPKVLELPNFPSSLCHGGLWGLFY